MIDGGLVMVCLALNSDESGTALMPSGYSSAVVIGLASGQESSASALMTMVAEKMISRCKAVIWSW